MLVAGVHISVSLTWHRSTSTLLEADNNALGLTLPFTTPKVSLDMCILYNGHYQPVLPSDDNITMSRSILGSVRGDLNCENR